MGQTGYDYYTDRANQFAFIVDKVKKESFNSKLWYLYAAVGAAGILMSLIYAIKRNRLTTRAKIVHERLINKE